MARPKTDVLKRFISKVQMSPSGCQEWTAHLHRDGYGSFSNDGKTVPAHRMAYRLFVGNPDGRWVLHKCDNRKCVNPDHLFLGDAAANVRDMDAKQRRGSKSRLTFAQVGEIRSLLGQRYSQQTIAGMYGVCQSVISRIKLGKTNLFLN